MAIRALCRVRGDKDDVHCCCAILCALLCAALCTVVCFAILCALLPSQYSTLLFAPIGALHVIVRDFGLAAEAFSLITTIFILA